MFDILLNGFVTLFVIIDPPGLVPLFLTLTPDASRAQRRTTATRACFIAALVLVVFGLAGSAILSGLGITLPAFRVAGGLFLFWIGFELVFERRGERKQKSADEATRDYHGLNEIAAVPLGIPLMAGPGAISAVILLSSSLPTAVGKVGLVAVIALVMTLTLGILHASHAIDRLIGATGRAVISRLLGVLLAALAVQFVADGVRALAASG